MFGNILRQGLGIQPELQDNGSPAMQPMGLNGSLMQGIQGMQGFQMSPQRGDMFGQYNNPMMFMRRM